MTQKNRCEREDHMTERPVLDQTTDSKIFRDNRYERRDLIAIE